MLSTFSGAQDKYPSIIPADTDTLDKSAVRSLYKKIHWIGQNNSMMIKEICGQSGSIAIMAFFRTSTRAWMMF
jgi:hypothetical protein